MRQVPPPPRRRKSSRVPCAAEAGRASCSAVVGLLQPMQTVFYPRSSRSHRVSHHHHLLRSWWKRGMPDWTDNYVVEWRWTARGSCLACSPDRCIYLCHCCGSREHIGHVFARYAVIDGWRRRVYCFRRSNALRARCLLAKVRQSATCSNSHDGLAGRGRDVDTGQTTPCTALLQPRQQNKKRQRSNRVAAALRGQWVVRSSGIAEWVIGWFGSNVGVLVEAATATRQCMEFHTIR